MKQRPARKMDFRSRLRRKKRRATTRKATSALAGSTFRLRTQPDPNGKPEFSPLQSHYGYIKGTVGADKDHVDIFVKQGTPTDYSGPVFVVNQHNASGKFDEHKAVIGVQTAGEAKKEYLANYEKGWTGGKTVVKFDNPQDFKAWATNGPKGQPAKAGEILSPGTIVTEANTAAVSKHLGLVNAGKLDRVPFITAADPTHGGNLSIPIGATIEEAAQLKQAKADLFSGPTEKVPEGQKAESALLAKIKARIEGDSGEGKTKVVKLVQGAMGKHRDLLNSLDHPVTIKPTTGDVTTQLGIGVTITRSGFPQILVDFDKLTKETAGFSDRERSRTIQRGIDEEVLHLAALKWEAKAPENKAKLTAWGAEDDEIGKFLAKSYSGWEQLTDRQRGHEKARAVLQKRWTGRLTETARTVMRAMMEFFRGIYDKLTDTQREIIDGIEAILKGGNGEAKAAGVTASASTREGAATAGKPTGAPLEGKTQAEAPAVGKVTPQIPPLGGKYVLPSFVTEQYAGKKLSPNQQRAYDLSVRLYEVVKSDKDVPMTDAAVVETLLKSGSGKALDQAERKIAKYEGKNATTTGKQQSSKGPELSRIPPRKDVREDAPEIRKEEGAKADAGGGTVERGETPNAEQEPVTGQPDVSTPQIDDKAKAALNDALEGLFAGKPFNFERFKMLKEKAALDEFAVSKGYKDAEAIKASDPNALDEARRQYRESEEGIRLGAGKPMAQMAIPVEKLPKLITAAQELIRSNIETPEKLAQVLEAQFGGKARPYSQALWDAIGIVRPDLRGTHDWAVIYAPPPKKEEKAPLSISSTSDEAPKSDTITDQVARRLLSKQPLTRTQLTEMAKELAPGLSVKEVDEAAEAGVVAAARTTARSAAGRISPVDTYDRLVEQYSNQPNLTAKTSTSKVNQAYSTPSPLAYAASRLADISGGKSVYEPTAGNGILLIEADPHQKIYANEINAGRLASLKALGFEPTAQDATSYLPPEKVDRMAENPPFGTILDANGNNKTWPMWDSATNQIDFAIAAHSLEALTDDGRAVLILGGKNIKDPDERAKAYASEKQADFWKRLYEKYRVVDHFTIDGDLYSKQGAGWPVDVVVIAGRGKSPIQLPSANGPRIIDSWDGLRDEITRTDAERIEAGRYDLERDREKLGGVIDSIRGVAGVGERTGAEGNAQPSTERDGGARGDQSVARSDTEPQPATASGGVAPTPAPTAERAGAVGAGGTERSDQQPRQQLDFRVPYKPASKLPAFGIYVPTNMEVPARDALATLQGRVGAIDDFVRGKLGYRADAPLEKYFSAEQMDALALAIDAIDGETAFVLGDQGGVGKGRVAAGMMRYAIQQKKVPIFITKDEKLYAAMIEDLHDIGSDDVIPLFTNNDLAFEDYAGRKWVQGKMTDAMDEIAREGVLPKGFDVVFTTYAQIQSDQPKGYKPSKAERASLKGAHTPPPNGARMDALRMLAPGSIIIADESHLASGDSIRAWRLAPLLEKAHGVYYSSATFAKRPDSMGIYSRTSLSHATQSMEDLVGAMKQGGVPLQQVVSATLAADGLYMRRERDFSHAVFRTHINTDTRERDARLADNYTDGLRTILAISNKMKAAKDYLNKILRREAKQMQLANAPRIETTNFSSKLHNLVSQYLFAIKAESMVRRAVEGVTKGFTNVEGKTVPHKVIIAVQNTMEQPILALERGGRPLTFTGMLLAYLDSMRELRSGRGQNAQVTTITDQPNPKYAEYNDKALQDRIIVPTDDPENPKVDEEALAELFRRIMAGVFKEAAAKIEQLDLADMPVSPIDHIRRELSRVGIKNAEITKRGIGIDEDGVIYRVNPSSNTKAAHLRYLADFNNSDTDVLVINASGSTGVSAHSSTKFKRQDPRAMIIGQPHLDINEFVQTLYRIDRTGQVHQPYYELLQTAIPAELRPAAILGRKMGSLNANTTSNAENEVSAGNKGTDIFNQYGDEVVYNYLRSDAVFTSMLDMPKIMDGDKISPIEDVLALYEEDGQFAAAVTGRVAVLPTAEQEEFWNKVTSDYSAKIDYLNELGENELLADTVDLKAETEESKELTPATSGKGRPSGFDQPSRLEKIKADIGSKPLEATEVVTMMDALGENAHQLRQDWLNRSMQWREAELKRLSEKVLSWSEEKAEHYQARWREQEEEINAAIGLIGSGLHLKTAKGLDGYGAITEVAFDNDHPLTPSRQIFTVHVNTTKKTVRIPASQLPQIARMAVGDFAKLYESTAERSNTRYMVTGNLLSAYLAIRDAAPMAKIVQYTNDKGELRQGILMPAKFTPGALAKKQLVESPSHMRQLLDAGRALTNSDGSVTVVKPRGDYILRVPASKVMGGAFWRDSELASLMDGGEFIERGGGMVGKFPADKIPDVYTRLLDLKASLFFTANDTETLGAAKPFKAATDFYKQDVEDVAKNIGLTVKESLLMLRKLLSPTSGVQQEAHDRAMKMLGERNQKAYETDRVLDAWSEVLDKLSRQEQIAFIDRMKQGQTQATPELQELAVTMRKIDTESWEAAREAYSALGFKDNEIPLAWLENHYRVLWKTIPGATKDEKAEWIGKARRGLRGSMGQHKQHTLETMSDGLEMGGIPYSYNPVYMFKLAQADLWKLTTTLKAWKWAKDTGHVEFVRGPFPKRPDGMVPLDDSIAKVYFPAESGEGLINAGQYFVEEGFGRLLNNYLSTDHIREVRIGRGLMWIKNATTALELSLSPFHAIFETLDAVGSNLGLGLQKLVNRGVLGGSAKAVAEGLRDMVTAIGTPVTHGLGKKSLGAQIRLAAGNPDEFFKTADGAAMLKSYPRAREMIEDLFSAGWKPTELEQDWRTNSVRTFTEAVGDIKAGDSANYIGAGLRAFPAANEMLMRPLFDYYIPNLKVAQFFKEYAEAIKQNESKLKGGVLTRAALARQTWRFVEDRFGEMNYDNLFWNRTFKSAMQLMFRSVTWKLGSASAFAGAFGGQGREFRDAFKERRAPELHRNTAWLFGMFLLTAALGTILSIALGKRTPQSLTDLVFPRVDPKDDKIRVSLPTYFKDLVHLIHSPTSYVTSSMSGWIGRAADMLRNKDYYGVQIRDTDDSIVKQALQVGKYTGETVLPFSIRGYKNLSAQDVGALRKAVALLGVNPAPRFIAQTPAERASDDYWRGQRSEAGIRPEQLERKSEKRHLVAQIEHGDAPDISGALAKGTIKPKEVKAVYQRAQMGALPASVLHMPLADAERIFERANLSERAKLAPIMAKKRANAAKAGRSAFSGF
jgi:hypothetical protein